MKTTEKIFSVATPEESTGFLLWQVTNLWQREIKKALEKYKLTHSQFVLMASVLWLTQDKKGITQITLSLHTKIDPMTTSVVLRTLQKKGYLQRAEHEIDTRAKSIALTPEGKKIAKLAVKTVENFDAQFFTPVKNQAQEFNNKLHSLLLNTTRK